MAFFTLTGTMPANALRRTDEGARGRAYPWDENATEVREVLPSCASCTLRTDHGEPCSRLGVSRLAGELPTQDIPAGRFASASYLVRLDGALWALAFIGGAIPLGNYLSNLGMGTANNVAQDVIVEVLSVDGGWITVRSRPGEDPRRLIVGVSRLNPLWPLPDPQTGSTARLQSDNNPISLPVGSSFEPLFPSVLYRKLTPMVTEIEMPTAAYDEAAAVTYRVKTWGNMANIREPYDRKRPPSDGKYFARIAFRAIAQERYANWQDYPVAHWTRASVTKTAAELTALSGVVPLVDTNGDPCRVLPRYAGGNVLVVRYVTDAGTQTWGPAETDAALTVADLGTGWSSSINLSPLLSIPSLVSIQVFYMPEARTDDGAAYITPGACRNSQIDWSGSVVHGSTRRCVNVACSKFQAGQFRDECFDPAATGFLLAPGAGPGPDAFSPADAANNQNLAEIAWSGCGLVEVQGLPGQSSYRNFAFEARDRTGLQHLAGGYVDAIPTAANTATVQLYNPRVWGRRRVYTDQGDRHELTFGLFDSESTGAAGSAFLADDSWATRTNQLRLSRPANEAIFPSFGPAPMDLRTGRLGGGAMRNRLRRSDQTHELTVAGSARNRESQPFQSLLTRLIP